jgi:DNA-binding transcriptional MerR regulator
MTMSEAALKMLERQARTLVTRKGAAEILGKSRSTIMFHTLTGALKATVIGGQRFYNVDDVQRLKRRLDARHGIEPSK